MKNFDSSKLHNYVLCKLKGVDKLNDLDKLSELDQFQEGDQVCIDCINQLEYKKCLSSICYMCKINYKSVHNGTLQGNKCSSTVTDEYIIGSYGSYLYDGEKVIYKNRKPSYLKYGSNVCDSCITKLINDGVCILPIRDYE